MKTPVEILQKRPFTVTEPYVFNKSRSSGRTEKYNIHPKINYVSVPQDEFLSEWDTNSHYINIRPDWKDDTIFIEDEEGNKIPRTYHLQRRTFPLQKMIHTKRCSHLCTNPINFQINNRMSNAQNKKRLTRIREYWTEFNMEIMKNELISKAGKCGDSAAYMYIDENDNIKYCIFSYDNGDTLYPYYDRMGNMTEFGRKYHYAYTDAEGVLHDNVYMDIWDKNAMVTYVQEDGISNVWEPLKIVDDDGFERIAISYHNLGFLPIGYLRFEDGPFWFVVQDLIDDFELVFSMMSESNIRLGFQTLMVKTSTGNFNMKKSGLGGTPILLLDMESDAQFMGKTDASNSMMKELESLYSNILDGAGIVTPMKSINGDAPTGSVAMNYEPENEIARKDKNTIVPVLTHLCKVFKYYVGMLENDIPGYNSFSISAKLDIYSYIDFVAWNQMLVSLYNTGIISGQTAREECDVSADDEETRMEEEEKKMKEKEAEEALRQQQTVVDVKKEGGEESVLDGK